MAKIAYILVTDNFDNVFENTEFCQYAYTREMLKQTLQILGCKARHAEKISLLVYSNIEEYTFGLSKRKTRLRWRMHPCKGQFCISMSRNDFNDIVIGALTSLYAKTNISDDWRVATSLRENRKSITILLCGTSGTGKSTLASLLAARLGITTVMSTDCVRGIIRSYSKKEDVNSLIYASTYEAGKFLDRNSINFEGMKDSKLIVKGYKAQSETVLEKLEHLIESCEQKNESLICEGAHLSLNFVIRMMRKYLSIIPFLIYITNEEKHKERFAIRAKYMAMDETKNKYTKNIENIRLIQDFLIRKSEKHSIPKINNTNVDRSVALIHMTVFGCIKKMMKGEKMYDPFSNSAQVVFSEYTQIKETSEFKKKDALELIRKKVANEEDFPASSSSMISIDDREDISDEYAFFYKSENNCETSDSHGEIASNVEYSSDDDDDDNDDTLHEPTTEYGSLLETTDPEEHDE